MKCKIRLWILLAVSLFYLVSESESKIRHHDQKTYYTRLIIHKGICEILSLEEPAQLHRLLTEPNDVIVESRPLIHDSEHSNHDHSARLMDEAKLVDIFGYNAEKMAQKVKELCSEFTYKPEEMLDDEKDAKDEVIRLRGDGDPSNRIDIVFMGDGYTAEDKKQFIADMERLTDDMFNGQTFSATLPLYNVWAVFRPSKDRGIGTGGKPKSTSFGLYRDGTELRGIYCSKPGNAREACKSTGPHACDYPSLIGNDLYYGGLGGEFTISTSSGTSGTVVLRHELGHNLIEVGEEYDGGQVYSGCNAARSLSAIGWKAWLTEPEHVRAESNAMRVQNYAWYDLKKGAYSIRFRSDGRYKRWLLKFSASGVETQDSLEVTIDGQPLPWKTSGNFDRSFTEVFNETALSAGEHVLEFRQGFPANESAPIRQLCSVSLHEYADEQEYHFDNKYVGAYPTFGQFGGTSYRPTNEACLMRNMTSVHLCDVCQEGIWLKHLKRVSLIDSILAECDSSKRNHKVTINAIPLAQFRKDQKIDGERYILRWFFNGQEQHDLENQFSFMRENSKVVGKWEATLKFETPQVRTDPGNLLTAKKTFEVEKC